MTEINSFFSVWPNSLVRRPPWLNASSVKNKASFQSLVIGIYNFVYRHDSVDAQNPLCPLMFQPDHSGSAYDKYLSQVGPIYSNMDALEFLRHPNDNSIHFKLAYPRTTNYDQFVWKQISNPVSQENVEGFEMQQESFAYVL